MFDNIELITSEQLESSEIIRNLLKIEVPKSIEKAMSERKVYATVFEINTSNSFVDIHKQYWADAIQTCINWYIEDETEDYEFCRHLSKLIEELKTKKHRHGGTTL
jgi:hypothetical protein